ncbi:inner membrane-spanning protein YciB [Novosphingobium sp.]|uniref:inner membrane-spanning protein YciB n=1 Tax=Novosphingobium sp. TaxID=1874826 RepID=UPI0035B164D2
MTQETEAKKPGSGLLNLLVDYGPIAVFFAIYRYYAPSDHNDAVAEVLAVIRGTVAFMVTAVAALAVSRWKLGKISPMLWLSTGLIVVFGGLTVFFQDERWIQIKPTVIYLGFGAALLLGAARGKPLLKYLLAAAFEGLNDAGWMKLSRNWGFFFFFLAALNEVLRRQLEFGDWIAAKLWLFMPLTFLFTFAHIPMLLKHGMSESAEAEVITDPPHE